jgi:hypothetical protein
VFTVTSPTLSLSAAVKVSSLVSINFGTGRATTLEIAVTFSPTVS